MISTPIKTNLAKIAIIGRQNVGKSTLFNRLLRKRRAITDPTPGVTRDAVEVECTINDNRFILVDTGGFTTETGDYAEIVSAKSIEAAGKADLILLVMDVNEITGNDREFIERIRPFINHTILIVNKVDNPSRELEMWNFHELGFPTIIPVSALHAINMDVLEKEITGFLKSHDTGIHAEQENIIRIAILGKPNTGKSTLINTLLGEEKSLVSDKPGTTRDVVEGKFNYRKNDFLVLDTAGIRRKSKVKNDLEYYSVNRAIKSIQESDIIFLLIESVSDISDQDKKIAYQIDKHGKGMIFVLNKWDMLPDIPNRLEAMKDRLHFLFPVSNYTPVMPLSAVTGFGLKQLLDMSLRIWKQLNTQIETGRLNKIVKTWMEQYPHKVKGKELKIRYVTQTGINPLRFIFFLNKTGGMRKEFASYIKNRIRNDFKLDLVPIEIEFRQ